MKVELVSITKPTIIPEGKELSPEELIIYIARVSSSRKDKTENYEPLIRYLVDNKHWSPFEMVNLTFHIETTRAITHQLVRHRSFSFQEFSQRYSKDIQFEDIEYRKQCENNRQSSTEPFSTGNLNRRTGDLLEACEDLYHDLLHKGISRETARMILPNCTTTNIYMNGTLRSWIHFLEVRDDEHAQLEIQHIAKEIKKIVKVEFPTVSDALKY